MSRRVGGGGCFQRKNGQWVGQLDLGWSNSGKRLRKTLYGATEKDVLAAMKAESDKRGLGVDLTAPMPMTGPFLLDWLQDVARPSVRASTFTSYSSIVKVHLAPAFKRVALDHLTPAMVRKFLNEKRATGLSARRVQYLHAVLRIALRQAVEDHLVPANVARSVRPPKVERRRVAAMTQDEAQALVAAFEGHRLEGLVTVVLGLGLRLGEALGLGWEQVDLEHRQLRVVATLQRLPDQDGVRQWVLGPPKSEQSTRTLPLPEAVADALQSERKRQAEAQLAAGPSWHETGFVFTGRTGEPWTSNGALHAFQAQLAAAGIPRMRLHDLRHGCASLLLAQGVPARVVMEVLGHSQISMTLDTYSHVAPALLGDAAKAMNATFRPA